MLIALGAAAVSFAISFLFMPFLIKYLKSRQFGQTIYELGPQAHLNKQGTPNMGGILIVTATVLASLFFSLIKGAAWQIFPLLVTAIGAMAIGFRDDFIKNIRKNHEGLKPKQKLIGQVFVGLLFSVYCYFQVGSSIFLPFTSATWDMGVFYIPLMTLVFVFMTNSANLQDGADGLLSSVSIVGGIAFGVIALMLQSKGALKELDAVVLLSFALVGACIGFLIYNHYPAKIMMGDTGSMFIGGLFSAIAMILGLQFWLIFICFTMIMSSVSVIIQRIYFKMTHGKRIFKMSPIHHHFELSGMKENSIVVMYTLITLGLSVMAVLAVVPLT
ncbi:MAG: phospho-N-acetylmuramoyl-pentapeptide-transferase [Clostridiales bacterium]|nr:phospho-N-acetylmuramoyl-pentapeptide-transferase [Clostridiales bacterium]